VLFGKNIVSDEVGLLASAFEGGSPLLIADRDQLVIKANLACIRLSGLAEDALLGMALEKLYSPDKNPHIDVGFRGFLQAPIGIGCFSGKTVRRGIQGDEIHFIETITALKNESGMLENYLVNFQDVTNLVHAQSALVESQETYRRLIESMHDGVLMIVGVEVVDCNARFASMMRCDKNAIVGRSITELSLPTQPDGSESGARAAQIFMAVREGESRWIDWTLQCRDGQTMEVEASLSPATLAGQGIMLATVRDITARNKIERERQDLLDKLAKKEELIRLAGKASGVVSWLLDIRTSDFTWSDGALESLGMLEGDLANSVSDISKIMAPEHAAELEQALADAISTGMPFKVEHLHRVDSESGEQYRWLRTQGQAETDPQGETIIVRGTLSDISDEKIRQEEIERLAYYDPLTGLANRRLLLDRLQQCCIQAERRGTSGAILFIDLDRFKLLNDSLGHQTGDELLKEVGRRLEKAVRAEDTVGRFGGDEFVVLLPSVEGSSTVVATRVRRIADSLRRKVNGDYDIKGYTYHMSASVGAAIFPRDGTRADDVLQRADAAMYLAKKSGRDTVAFYQTSLLSEANSRLAMERELRQAVELGQLELYYQPKVDVDQNGRVVGAEALLRWNHPEEGVVGPNVFIPIAEETGLIIDIGKWVLADACQQFVAWNQSRDARDLLGVSVNVSPLQFRQAGFVGDIKQILRQGHVEAGMLTIEITEGTFIDNLEDTRIKLEQLQKLGVRISIDDFGTGYSSLYYLKNLALDEIKIDRSYVTDIIDDPNDAAIVSSIMAIAKNLDLNAIAEGVETVEQAKFLQSIDCSIHQGYLYAKPLTAELFASSFLSTGADRAAI
jgi:diguanylate cyclase (GGDEF)-like protein/PAS domain S-box-containing protein